MYSQTISLLKDPAIIRLLDINRFKIFLKKQKGLDADFSSMIDDFLNVKKPIENKINISEVDNILNNIFNIFKIEINDDYKELEKQLINFLKYDNSILINNTTVSKKLFFMINLINHYKNVQEDFIKVSLDNNLELEDKGTAFSSNRNTSETVNPIINKFESVKKLLGDNLEINGMINLLNNYNKNPYDVIYYLALFNESTSDYLNNANDKEICEIILKAKKILNSSQGLKKEDFEHSLKYQILNIFKFNDVKELGFNSKDELKFFFEDLLEFLFDSLNIKMNYIKIDKRDFNQEIQVKDFYKENILYEKITPKNKRKHPVLDNPQFIKLFRKILLKSLKLPVNKFQRKSL